MVLATAGVRRVHDGRRSGENIHQIERVLSIAGGAAAILAGTRNRRLPGLALAAIGAALVRRGVTGHCPVYQALGVTTATGDQFPSRRPGELVSHAATVDARRAVKIERSIFIARSPDEIYRIWRDFSQLHEYLTHVES